MCVCCMCEDKHIHECICGGQGWSWVFSIISFYLYLKLGSITENLEFIYLVMLPGQQAPNILSPSSSTEFTGVSCHAWLSAWVLGIQTLVLMLMQQVFYPKAISPAVLIYSNNVLPGTTHGPIFPAIKENEREKIIEANIHNV